ncbi:hypothetical protein [Streptomyces sp. UNOC14_S4]|uniref:hypothetical protein n=1 Tax=Streptomyces sp. UNOC14_S4 TaxID=2872340 RepID=UPI001E304759|nr:hypothetical protein [Streptomyces sp. UNOC14_S4]MCC3767289.1 hypothetical protein [Streptomyces sp. UNOC14_S4]
MENTTPSRKSNTSHARFGEKRAPLEEAHQRFCKEIYEVTDRGDLDQSLVDGLIEVLTEEVGAELVQELFQEVIDEVIDEWGGC